MQVNNLFGRGLLIGATALLLVACGNGGNGDDDDDGNPPGASDVAQARAFIADLRTWGTVIGDELDSPAQAFGDQVDAASQSADFFDSYLDEGIAAATDVIVDRIGGLVADGDLTNYATEDHLFTAGTLGSTAGTAGPRYTISAATVDVYGYPVSVDAVVEVTPEGATTEIILDIQSMIVDDGIQRLEIDTGTIGVGLAEEFIVDYGASGGPEPLIERIDFEFDATMTWKYTIDPIGNPVVATDPVSFTGEIGFVLYPVLDGNNQIVMVLPESLTLAGSIGNTTEDSFEFGLSLSIDNADSIEPLGQVYDLDSSYADNNGGERLIEWSYSGDTFTYQSPDGVFTATLNGTQVDYVHPWFGASTDFGPFSSIQQFASTRDWLFQSWVGEYHVEGQGDYEREDYSFGTDFATDGFDSFRLADAEVEFFDQTQPAIGQVGLSFGVQFDSLPAATISLTGNATAFERGNVDLTIAYGDRSLMFDVSNDTADGEVGRVVITNLDGVQLVLDFDNLEDDDKSNDVQEVSINGKVVAELIEFDDGLVKVSYIDGTFEIF